MTRPDQSIVSRLRVAVDSAVSEAVADPDSVPEWAVEVVGAASALLRELGPTEPSPQSPRHDNEVRSWSVASGYTGDACGGCGSFTLRRKGTCLSCDSCPHSSGCS